MKYILRFIAGLPALTVGCMSVFLLVLSFDYNLVIFPFIINNIAFVILLDKYEETVKDLVDLLKVLCNKTEYYV